MAVTSPRRSERLRSALLDGRSGFSPILESASSASLKQCGACLLDIDTVSKDGDFVAILESCKPLHFFHVRCISTWAAQENTCPLCKVRFGRFGIYGADGDLRRVCNVEEKDQHETAEGASDEEEEVVCSVCQRSDNDHALLLCDGLGGHCKGAAHFYCLGLPGVPSGDWFCSECQELPLDASQASQDAEGSKPSKGSMDPLEATPEKRDSRLGKDTKEGVHLRESPKSNKRKSDLPVPTSKRLKGASAKEEPEVKKEVKKNNAGPSSRSASETSKWIRINGGLVQIELGGRRIKDAAAVDVAKLVRSVLERLRSCQRSSLKPLNFSLNLAGNRLGKHGLMTLLQALDVVESLELSVLNLEWNRIDASAVTWLASWLSKQAHPPRKLLLSHNSAIGEMAAQHLFQTLGVISKRSSTMPWVEAKYIGIKDLDAFMELLSQRVNFCFALDADACKPDRCASEEVADQSQLPQLHLVGILEQRLEEQTLPDSFEDSFRSSDSGIAFTRPTKRSSDSLPATDSQETVKSLGSSQGFEEPPQNVRVKQEPERQEDEKDVKKPGSDPDSVQRRKWAASLGKSGVSDAPDIDATELAPAPSFGMWDLACAEAKKRGKSKVSTVTAQRKGSFGESATGNSTAGNTEGSERGSKVTLRTLGTFSEKDSDYVALKAVVEGRVKRKTELWKALTITESEKWLRQKCLVNELCKQIFEEAFKTATASAGSWEAYLKTSIGQQFVNQWLDRKLSAATRAVTKR